MTRNIIALWRRLIAWWYGGDTAYPLARHADTLTFIEELCDTPGCKAVATTNVGDPGKHRVCDKHANDLVDLMLGAYSEGLTDYFKREGRGEFIPKPDTSRGFEVFKGGRL